MDVPVAGSEMQQSKSATGFLSHYNKLSSKNPKK
jgi:hypothetical protein